MTSAQDETQPTPDRLTFTPFRFRERPGLSWLIERMDVWHVNDSLPEFEDPFSILSEVYRCPGCAVWQVQVDSPTAEHETFWGAERLAREHLNACRAFQMMVGLTTDP